VDGSLKIAIASGDVTAGAVLGGTDVKSASGDLRIKIAATGVKAKTASGDITVGTLRSGDLDATCISGDVTVGIPEGRTVDVRLDSLTGRVSTEFPVRHDAEVDAPDDGDVSTIKIRAMSGDINLRPAETA
jgi:DUF4097 and DUF4098 domain-containing protein YvlB